MIKKITPKIVFIDTNIFIGCALEEIIKGNKTPNINMLEDIKNELENTKMILILPENIKAEIIITTKNRFENFKIIIKKIFEEFKENENIKESRLLSKEVKKSEEQLLKKIAKKQEAVLETIEEISSHKNTKTIELSSKLVISGIKRALLMKRPYTPYKDKELEANKNRKYSYSKDQDCVAFESLLNYLEKRKKKANKKITKCIICTNDSDYFDKKTNKLHNEITEEILSKCKEVSEYTSLLNMLEKEFNTKYSEKQKEEHKLNLEEIQTFNATSVFSMGHNLQSMYTAPCNINNELGMKGVFANEDLNGKAYQHLSIPDSNKAAINPFLSSKIDSAKYMVIDTDSDEILKRSKNELEDI